jgi:hypothetical protein
MMEENEWLNVNAEPKQEKKENLGQWLDAQTKRA